MSGGQILLLLFLVRAHYPKTQAASGLVRPVFNVSVSFDHAVFLW